MLWLAIRFPRLPVEVFLVGGNPAQAVPLIVAERQQVAFTSDAARDAGIRPGQKLSHARALCDGLHIRERMPEREQRWLERLAQRHLCLTPMVAIEPPATLLLEIGGSLKLFRGLAALLARTRELLHGTGLTHALGLGHTPLGAQLMSHAEDGAEAAAPHDAQAVLARLRDVPIALLPLPESLRERLFAPGFRQLGDLLALPRAALGRRMGAEFLDWLQRLLGEKPDPRRPIVPPERFQADVEFLDPVAHTDALLFPARRLLSELEAFLTRRQAYTRAIRWHFFDPAGACHTLEIRRAGTDPAGSVWEELTRRRFEHHSLPAPVLRLALECDRPQPMPVAEGGLFRELLRQRPGWSDLLDRLATLPRLELSMIAPAAHHQPELAQRLLAPDTARSPHTRHLHAPPPNPFLDTPLWLLDPAPPVPLRDGVPCWQRQPLTLLPHEQNLGTDWWHQPGRRHYRVAHNGAGVYCQLFRDDDSGQWFLQGFF